MLLQSIFVSCVGIAIYHHAIYPKLLARLAQWRRGKGVNIQPDVDFSGALPRVTLIVPAYNEGRFIARKIENLAALDYPRDRLKIVIVCDGCSDDTFERATRARASLADRTLDISIVAHPTNRGKVAVLNEAIGKSVCDVVALSDVSAFFAPGSLLAGVNHFRFSDIGAVCATYKLLDDAGGAEQFYWQYQTAIKADEAAVSAPMGAHGAFYMFRRVLWEPLPSDTINDDFIMPMNIVSRGWRSVYDSTIVAIEHEPTSLDQDFRRRRRISAGNLQQVLRLPRLADPARPGLAFVFLSGKALRTFMPFVFLAAFVASALLALDSQAWLLVLALECVVAGAALAGYLLGARSPAPLAVLGYVAQGYLASLLGTVDYIVQSRRTAWTRVNHQDPKITDGADFVHPVARMGKRTLDIVVSLIGLVGLVVVFLPIALLIKLESPGPIFYRQLRVGRSGSHATTLFYLTKFRTMRADAETKSGAVWATVNDPRITRVGRFLRKTRIDELPQFYNVLHGDMSIVGPRPERPQFFSRLEAQIPYYTERTFGLKPGITGFAQVSQGYDASIEDVRSKTLFDHAYAMRIASPLSWLKTDLEIIFKTFAVVILGKGQ